MKKPFKKQISLVFIGCILLISTANFAQTTFLQDINGRPFFTTSYTDYDGSPYLQADWGKGTVMAKSNGKTYQLAKMRYDVYKDELEYEESQKLYRFSNEILEFQINGKVFRRGFSSVDNLSERSFYEVLYDSKVKLLKRHSVKVQTEKPYNSATELKRFVKDEAFYLQKENMLLKIKKDKKSILEVLGKNQPQMEEYIKSQKLKLTKEEDIIKVVEHYNSLI